MTAVRTGGVAAGAFACALLASCGDVHVIPASGTGGEGGTGGAGGTTVGLDATSSSGTSQGSGTGSGGGETEGKPPAEAPNILLITSDDLGLQLGSYGEDRIETPSLDALAAEGVRFETAYVTQASCSSSRSSILTGLYPHTNGQYGLTTVGFALHDEIAARNLPRYLKDAGYRTGIIGKISVAPENVFPFDYAHKNVDETRDIELVADRAAEFMASARGQKFFLMVNYADPHAFPDPAGWYWPPEVNGYPEDPIFPGPDTLMPFQGAVDSPEHRARIADFLNSVSRMDSGVGMLLHELVLAGHEEDTLIIFVGDHGPPFERGKTTIYDAGLRVPLIVRWPGPPREPVVSTNMVSAVDIMPTILDAAQVFPPDPMQGISLWPMAWGGPVPARDYLVGEGHYHAALPFYPRRAIRNASGQKLIHNILSGQSNPSVYIDGCLALSLAGKPEFNGTLTREIFNRHVNPPLYELYDLANDPFEFVNLADDPAWADVRAELTLALADWQVQYDDPFRDPIFVQEMLENSGP